VLPLIVIWALAIGIVVIVVLSELFLIRTFPVPALTDSLKFKTIFEDTATPVALSAGVLDERVGGVVSAAEVKFRVLELVIPVKALSERSKITPLAISM
jgi:hypothetical protein